MAWPTLLAQLAALQRSAAGPALPYALLSPVPVLVVLVVALMFLQVLFLDRLAVVSGPEPRPSDQDTGRVLAETTVQSPAGPV